ncbi:MAG: LarC family nickel insertion protein [Elusimicrobiota bacterium]
MIIIDPYQGVSGDMLTGALIDLKGNAADFKRKFKRLSIPGVKLDVKTVCRHSLSGTKAGFTSSVKEHHRKFADIRRLVKRSGLDQKVIEKVIDTYDLIFKAEAAVHGARPEEVFLHELGRTETLCEIASFYMLLGKESVYCRPLKLGTGTVKAAHGHIPLPSPVTAEILKDIPVEFVSAGKEMVTPTAAAILKKTASFNTGQFLIRGTGYGFGSRSILRIFSADRIPADGKQVYQVEVTIDDMTAEDISWLQVSLMNTAMDAVSVPAVMKKGRIGNILSVICGEDSLEEVTRIILEKSSSAGLRYWPVKRHTLERKIVRFKSSLGNCRIKVLNTPAGKTKVKPEFDDLLKISKKSGIGIPELRRKVIEEYEKE